MTTYKQGSLYSAQIKAFSSGEPKTLGAIEIIIGAFIAIVGTIVYKLHLYIQREVIILIINGGTLVLIGIVLVHAGRKPSKCWVITNIVLQLLTAAFDIVAFGLAARQIPFRGSSYNLIDYEFLVNGILCTLIAFLVLACIIGLVVVLYGLYTLSVSALKEPTPIPGPTTDPLFNDTRGDRLMDGN